LKESSDTSETNRFRTIYIEDAIRDESLTTDILRRFPDVPRVNIRNYKDIFNRPRQDARWQARHPALILALQQGPFILPGPEVCQSFDAGAFFYSSLLLNCPFDCEYCFLQGMYPSKYTVAFVNTGDYVRAIREEAARHASMLLALSYDTDFPMYAYCRSLSGISRGWPSNFEPNPPSRPSIKTSRPPTTWSLLSRFPRAGSPGALKTERPVPRRD